LSSMHERDPIMRILKAALMLGVVLIPAYAVAAKMQAFKPGGSTILLSATTTATTVTLQGAGGSLLVSNTCTVPVRIDATGATATTPVTGTPPTPGSPGIPPSTFAVLEIGTLATTVSVKVDSGSACNVEMTRGEGMAH
jgi:hypothetical protein